MSLLLEQKTLICKKGNLFVIREALPHFQVEKREIQLSVFLNRRVRSFHHHHFNVVAGEIALSNVSYWPKAAFIYLLR